MRYRLRSLLIVLALGPPVLAVVACQWYLPSSRLPLALEGHCPVTLVESSHWQLGKAEYSAVHGGRLYLFASTAERRAFEKAPNRYAPFRGGLDIVRLVDAQRISEGHRGLGLFGVERVYLFDSEETLGKFVANPQKYISEAPRP